MRVVFENEPNRRAEEASIRGTYDKAYGTGVVCIIVFSLSGIAVFMMESYLFGFLAIALGAILGGLLTWFFSPRKQRHVIAKLVSVPLERSYEVYDDEGVTCTETGEGYRKENRYAYRYLERVIEKEGKLELHFVNSYCLVSDLDKIVEGDVRDLKEKLTACSGGNYTVVAAKVKKERKYGKKS